MIVLWDEFEYDDFLWSYGLEPQDEGLEWGKDEKVEEAEDEVLWIVEKQEVVTDRELKVRLEKKFFPWVVGRAIGHLFESENLGKLGYKGARGSSGTKSFIAIPGTRYDDVEDLMKKRGIASEIQRVLSQGSEVSRFSEKLFEEGLAGLGFRVHGRNVSSFKGKRVLGAPGRSPPNLDLVVERDAVVYGIDVKNWIRYQYDSRPKVKRKVWAARRLETIPWVIARYLDKDLIYRYVVSVGGLVYVYETLLFPPAMRLLAEDAKRYLGYPTLAAECLPDYKVE